MLSSTSEEEGRGGDGVSTALRGGIVKSVRWGSGMRCDGMNYTSIR